MNHLLQRSLVLAAILFISIGSHATDMNQHVGWIMTGTSPSVDRSSAYFANGDMNSGIKYATKALKRNLSPLDTLIATHNLCMAMTMMRDENGASDFCHKLDNMEKPAMTLKMIKPGLFKVSKRKPQMDKNIMMLGALIADNLAIMQQDSKVTLVR